MKKLAVLATIVLLASCAPEAPVEPVTGQAALVAMDARVDTLLAKMTLEEKVGQMTQPDQEFLANDEDIRDYMLGSVLSGGGSDPDAPVISGVKSSKLKGGKFKIAWTTDIASDSAVTFTCCGTYTNSSLVTSHSMQFNGTIGATYEYYVSSTANGQTATAGPFVHQNLK